MNEKKFEIDIESLQLSIIDNRVKKFFCLKKMFSINELLLLYNVNCVVFELRLRKYSIFLYVLITLIKIRIVLTKKRESRHFFN